MRIYSNPNLENDKWSLPDVEVFYNDGSNSDLSDEETGESLPEGYYFWFCLPGCLPDSSPFGPYETEEEAIEKAQEMANE